mmetsp:Transcript_13158/g.35136  ORF Transcript_13158/g.35136 Transcript_13158/m.35136 type:complete len:240 (+) Transcript_13158:1842-2561(+)
MVVAPRVEGDVRGVKRLVDDKRHVQPVAYFEAHSAQQVGAEAVVVHHLVHSARERLHLARAQTHVDTRRPVCLVGREVKVEVGNGQFVHEGHASVRREGGRAVGVVERGGHLERMHLHAKVERVVQGHLDVEGDALLPEEERLHDGPPADARLPRQDLPSRRRLGCACALARGLGAGRRLRVIGARATPPRRRVGDGGELDGHHHALPHPIPGVELRLHAEHEALAALESAVARMQLAC